LAGPDAGASVALEADAPLVPDVAEAVSIPLPLIAMLIMNDKEPATILLVEDEDDLRELAVELLQDEGYRVKTARNGVEGLEKIMADREIDLLFTDIVMPGDIDGWELARRSKKLRPELRVLYTSGFLRSIPADERELGYGPLLPKPWRPRQLLEHLHKLLDSAADADCHPSCRSAGEDHDG
jgi:CheY-like chemotaxis protein